MRVLAALSGGVDSAVAAAKAVEDGHEVVGVHMALSSQPQECRIGSRGCCSVEDAGDAAHAAEILGIPFYVWDLAEEFEQTVITDFIDQYRAGYTPNPCVRCNEFVKFKELAERARVLGFDAVCTGHYARITEGHDGPELHRGRDELKDQSYVLAVMGYDELSRVILPLGDATSKAWVRSEAERLGLGVSHKPDSYDICFIPDGNTQGFLRAHLGSKSGDIIDVNGNVLGEHGGYWNYTVGQRKGLGLENPAADGKPRYVLETRPESNQVIVGAATLLSVNTIECNQIVWLAPDDNGEIDEDATRDFGIALGARRLYEVPDNVLTIQVRAHGAPSVVEKITFVNEASMSGSNVSSVQRNNGTNACGDGSKFGVIPQTYTAMALAERRFSPETLTVRCADNLRGVAAGQSLVLYRGTRVIAEATIVRATRHP